MKRTILVVALAFGATGAGADQSGAVSGAPALALAALVAQHEPGLSAKQRRVMLGFLDGATNLSYPAGRKIRVSSDSIVCRASNVAIVKHSCELKFGAAARGLTGRAAHEFYATLIEAGVQGDGAAGSTFESLKRLSCTIDPNEVKANGGGGASCSFTPGP